MKTKVNKIEEESIKVNFIFLKIEVKNPSVKGICIIILVLAFLIWLSS